ncbi:magnesium and cobalt transporter [Loktanella sp. DSM 29012]|uniref:Hemolysin family protein n=1 Tax=Loktanella gaetbuli TaxID=2881335 RepID=A0ABS8BUR4_9RHOB|nr:MULTISPECIES: hemolysin family protein [Loktanella]MCB5199479.1 hemolysin family protein [Loktanella gaetbuli]SEQ06948.1 magnesium and cobalt transporter [Loktanella sp. DSM 29012]
MNDNDDRSGSHADRDDQSDDASRGFFARLFEALSPNDDTSDLTPETLRATGAAAPMLGMLNLRRLKVEDVAVPKADIKATPVTTSKDELVEVFRQSGLTRLPVFDGTLDTPMGFVNLKDFALQYGFNGEASAFDLRALLRPLLYVPPSMHLGILLAKMQTERIHMALVIDEYGGTDGLVTIEDLIEQVVGAIEDEHDVDEVESWTEEAPGVYLVQAKTGLEEFEAEIGMNLTEHEEIDEEEIDSLGGLVFMLTGHVPVRGEVIQHPDGPEFEVVDADPRRIKRLRVRMPKA